MKLGQSVVECNMRNVFLKGSYTKCCGEISPRLFYQKSKLGISLEQSEILLISQKYHKNPAHAFTDIIKKKTCAKIKQKYIELYGS